MNNAVHQPQTVLVLGGTSDIGQAIVSALVSPSLRRVILAVRDPDQVDVESLTFGSANVVAVAFDATDSEHHEALIADVAERYGDLDVVIQAFGQLGAPGLDDPVAAAELATVNYVGAVSSGLAVAHRLARTGPRDTRRAVERGRCAHPGVELRLRVDEGRSGCVRHGARPSVARLGGTGAHGSPRIRAVVDDRWNARRTVLR